jgi:hypothetical protein
MRAAQTEFEPLIEGAARVLARNLCVDHERAALSALGCDHALAKRLQIFVPFAFGRALFPPQPPGFLARIFV